MSSVKLDWTWRQFAELTIEELYAILALRQEVFIIEQNCIFPDIDYRDQAAKHLLGHHDNKLLSYLRLLPENAVYPNSVTFGRIVTSPLGRGCGLGRAAMAETLLYLEKQGNRLPIVISAQLYLQSFYESFGFDTVNQPYAEDGIPHIQMRKLP